jgi:hypothetical protein
MTIKFEHLNLLGPFTFSKNDLTHYVFTDDKHPDRRLIVLNDDFEKLFKDMAKELGYNVYKNEPDYITNKEFIDKCKQKDNQYLKPESEHLLDLRLERLENKLKELEKQSNLYYDHMINNDSDIQKIREQLSGFDEWSDYISEQIDKLLNENE